jgi:hypothetical protein
MCWCFLAQGGFRPGGAGGHGQRRAGGGLAHRPFTEYLDGDCCAWVDPTDPASIAAGIAHALDPARGQV